MPVEVETGRRGRGISLGRRLRLLTIVLPRGEYIEKKKER